jgi:hypothetical protein
MVWMQAGTIVKGTARGYAAAALSGEGSERGKEALQSYASWVQVSDWPTCDSTVRIKKARLKALGWLDHPCLAVSPRLREYFKRMCWECNIR